MKRTTAESLDRYGFSGQRPVSRNPVDKAIEGKDAPILPTRLCSRLNAENVTEF